MNTEFMSKLRTAVGTVVAATILVVMAPISLLYFLCDWALDKLYDWTWDE